MGTGGDWWGEGRAWDKAGELCVIRAYPLACPARYGEQPEIKTNAVVYKTLNGRHTDIASLLERPYTTSAATWCLTIAKE
jgi:hypothetical protein